MTKKKVVKPVKKKAGKSVKTKGTAKKSAKTISKKSASKKPVKKKKAVAKAGIKKRAKIRQAKRPRIKRPSIKKKLIKVKDSNLIDSVYHHRKSFYHKAIQIEKLQPNKPVFVQHKTKLKVGKKAPWFEGKNQNGKLINNKTFKRKNLVLYFYPKDHTPGCTAEACSLRNSYPVFRDANYEIIAVSANTIDSHRKFMRDYSLPFTLIADTEKKIIKAYDVWGPKQSEGTVYEGIVRTTFVINSKGIIKHIVTNVDSENHAKQLMGL